MVGRGVFLSPKPREFIGIDVTTGQVYFRYRHTPLAARTEVAATGRQFAVHGRTLYAYGPTPNNGYAPAWYFEARGRILAGPVEVGGAVYIGDDKGYLYRLEADDQ